MNDVRFRQFEIDMLQHFFLHQGVQLLFSFPLRTFVRNLLTYFFVNVYLSHYLQKTWHYNRTSLIIHDTGSLFIKRYIKNHGN